MLHVEAPPQQRMAGRNEKCKTFPRRRGLPGRYPAAAVDDLPEDSMSMIELSDDELLAVSGGSGPKEKDGQNNDGARTVQNEGTSGDEVDDNEDIDDQLDGNN